MSLSTLNKQQDFSRSFSTKKFITKRENSGNLSTSDIPGASPKAHARDPIFPK